MKLSNIKYFCTTNGDGFRTAIFVSGCNLHCKGCFNSKAWDFNFGIEVDEEVKKRIFDSIDETYIDGLSILGGEPMDPKNQEGVADIVKCFRERFGDTKNIWLWTGYVFDNIPKTKFTEDILHNLDYIVDGPYDEDKSDLNLRYRGSSNQRIIDLKKSYNDMEIQTIE